MDGAELTQRLAAILAADAHGYSRLMAANERATVVALDAARSVFKAQVESNQGRVVDMAGDSVLAVFPTAIGAVLTALAVQEQLHGLAAETAEELRLRFRVGVHLGDVMEKGDGSVYGDGVNIAARLQALAEPGGVMVSESIRVAVRGKGDVRFVDQGEQTVKNIPEPVRAYSVTRDGRSVPTLRSVSPVADLSLPDKPSIAVLPIANMSGEPEHEYFADGMAEDIITELSRFHELLVIARNSTFTYKGKAVDVRTVAKDLGVRYVLEGTLRVVAERLRLNVSLVDCESSGTLWSERFDSAIEDLRAMPDEVTARIINSIRITIDRSEVHASRKLDAHRLRAWHLRAQALDLFYRWNRSEMLKAIELSRRAIDLSPGDAEGYSILAFALWAAAVSGWMTAGRTAIEEALALAIRAINLDEGLCRGHVVMSLVLGGLSRHDEAIAAAERACEVAPSDFGANNALGQALAYRGRYEEAISCFDRAVRLSPRDPLIYAAYQYRAIALFGLARYEEVIAAAQRVSRQLPEWVEAHTMLAAGFMGLGDREQAVRAIGDAIRLAPRLTVHRAMRRHPLANTKDAARLSRFLHDAGLPAA